MPAPQLSSSRLPLPADHAKNGTSDRDAADGARAPDAPLAETRELLSRRAAGRFGAIPAEALVAHLLDHGPEGDFSVHEAALDALIRRFRFAVADGLVVSSRPKGGVVLGRYETARAPGATAARSRASRARGAKKRKVARRRPYASQLEGVAPIAGSCDCPDFLKSSLGLCKHLLVVLDHVHESERKLSKARREQAALPRAGWQLAWDPRLALQGPHDRLAGLRLSPPPQGSANGSRARGNGGSTRSGGRARAPESLVTARKGFNKQGTPRAPWLERSKRRQQLLFALAASAGSAPDGSRRRGNGNGSGAIETTPAAAALVRDELERVERKLENEWQLSSTLRHLRSLHRKLYPYQREGVERFLAAGRLLLADDMGLGKTTQAIAACHALFEAGRVRRGLVIVPASLKGQWLREWQATTDVPAAVVDGTPTERLAAYRRLKRGFLILNYELLLRDGEAIRALEAGLIVLDEAQRIKNYATKSAVSVKALAPEFRLVLTGTPMENRLEELASILDWVDDVALAPKWRLVPGYTRSLGDGSKKGSAGARHLDSLRQRLSPCLLRRVRRDVLAQLPPREDTRVPVAMTPQQADEHALLDQPIAKLARVAQTRPLTQPEFLKLMSLLTKQRVICNGLGQLYFEALWPSHAPVRPNPTLIDGLFSPKLLELRRLIEDLALDQERKIVIFSQWRRMLRLAEWSVRDLLSDAGLESRFFTGAEKPRQRTRSVVDFHDDPRVRVLFLSDAGGVGLNLQRAASACINLELPWNPAVLEQRVGRIHRLGQDRPIDVYNLVSESGIEARIAGLLGTKQAMFSALFDGTSNDVRFDESASLLSRIERLVESEVPRGASASSGGTGAVGDAALNEVVEDDPDEAYLDDQEREEADVSPKAVEGADAGSVGAGDAAASDAGDGVAARPDAAGGVGADEAARKERAPATTPADPAAMLASLRVERTASGGVRIDAPPEAAGTLVALFQGMAQLIGAGLAAPEDGGE